MGLGPGDLRLFSLLWVGAMPWSLIGPSLPHVAVEAGERGRERGREGRVDHQGLIVCVCVCLLPRALGAVCVVVVVLSLLVPPTPFLYLTVLLCVCVCNFCDMYVCVLPAFLPLSSSDDQGGSGAKDARKAHQEIEKRLKEGHREIREQVKLLLLGPGESGKSTIFKQMKILARPGGYTEAELMALRPIVYSNCLKEMQVLSKYALESDKDFDSEENKQRAVRMEDLSVDDWSPHVATDIKALWEDSRIQSTYARRNVDFQLNDSAS